MRDIRIPGWNEEASAGGLAGIFILFVVCALFTAFLGPIPDAMNHAQNSMIGSGLPMSQDRISTLAMLSSAFAIMAFVILIAAGVNYWVISIQEQNGDS